MTEALERLAALAQQETERAGLADQLEVARNRLTMAAQRHDEAVARLTDELEDVARLESMSMTRILAGLRGSRDVDLSREQAEAEAARYAAAETEARRSAAERELADLERRVAGFGDLAARRTALLAQRELEIASDPAGSETAAQLTELAEREGVREAEAVQLDEAITAAEHAVAALGAAQQHLASAGDWATYDTFFGGGMVTDMMKYDRLDRAGALMQQADAALGHLATELADVGVDALGGIGITQMTQAFDVWFDNIFSDWAVRDRIRQAAARVDHLLAAVVATGDDLRRRRREVAADLAAIAEKRERLLTG